MIDRTMQNGGDAASGGADAIIALGSNMGDKVANIAAAIDTLTGRGDIRLVRRSRDYRTAPWGKTDQDWFVNACISVDTALGPHELLARCQDAERRLGRVRAEKWGPRVIDVDILWWKGGAVATPDLKLPHPFIAERAFVLVPLADIAPNLVLGGRTVRQLLAAIDTGDVLAMP
jgi:2-amino-4-hydroxy-6-hydroxymethyldihydropteridine diphosphokinase